MSKAMYTPRLSKKEENEPVVMTWMIPVGLGGRTFHVTLHFLHAMPDRGERSREATALRWAAVVAGIWVESMYRAAAVAT